MASPLTFDTIAFPLRAASVRKLVLRLPSYTFARTSLAATLLAAPLAFGAVQAWAWAAMAVAAFLLLLLWSMASVREGTLRILWSPLYLPAGFFLLLGMIQFAARLTLAPMATREALLKLSTDLILFFLAVQLFAARPNGVPPSPSAAGPYVLRWTLVVYAFLLALFAIFQFFSSPGLIYWRVASPGWTFGPYVNHNHYAGLMEMLIPLSIASALPALRKHPSAALLGCLLLIPIASLLLSGSRGGFIAFLAEVLLTAALVFRYGPRHARKITTLLGASTLLAAGLLSFWMAPRQIAERVATMADPTHPPEVALADRLAPAKDSLRIFRDHPWVGAGLGSFETVFPQYQSFPSDFTWDHAHNDYAEALAETGAAGGALILFSLGLFFRLAFRNLRERLLHREGWLPIGAAIGCCGVLVHSFVDFNLHIPANAAWFAVCAAIATCVPKGTMRRASL